MSARTPIVIPDVPRTLRHMDTDEQWSERSAENKLGCTATEAAHRLRGLASVLYGLGMTTSHRLHELSFLGAAVSDIALALDRAQRAHWATQEAEDEKAARKASAKRRTRR
jgi:hypothetical protein